MQTQSLTSLISTLRAIKAVGPKIIGKADYDQAVKEYEAEIAKRSATPAGKRKAKKANAKFDEIQRQMDELDYKFDASTNDITNKTTYTIQIGSHVNTCTFKPGEAQCQDEWIAKQLAWFKQHFNKMRNGTLTDADYQDDKGN